MSTETELTIRKGKHTSFVLRWEQKPIVYKPITAITQSAPVELTVPSHGIPPGWRAAVVSVNGMTQLNAENPPKKGDYREVTVVSADKIQFNDVNSANYKAYVSGGYVQFNTPVDLAGYTARMDIRDKVGGSVLDSLTTENGGIAIDNTAKTITIIFTSVKSAAYAWKKGVYELELISASGIVSSLLIGVVLAEEEVTKP